MPLATFQSLCIDVGDLRVSGSYWATMLGWTLEVRDDDVASLRDDAGRTQVWLNRVPEPKTVKNRIHIDVNAESLDRALDAGATFHQAFPRWTQMLDPDGQEHCIFVREEVGERAYELGWDTSEGGARALAVWWAEVLGGTVGDNPEEGYTWVEGIPGCVWESLDFNDVPEPKTTKNRIHLDVDTDDLDALVAHGARVLRRKGDDGLRWTVLADPEGNEFCAFTAD
jgi:glyoxalase superfamily protein